jgi:NAD(P)H-hydrate epimerase
LRPLTRVVTGAESAADDAATIAAGVPSRALMQRAGAAAAAEISSRFGDRLRRGALVLAGPGNNGGDGWVIARALAATGAHVSVIAPAGARSADCISERDLALPFVNEASGYTGEGVVIDALLGTGASGALRGPLATARALIPEARNREAAVVAVDLPSGLDATTGVTNDAAVADLTLTFGSIKRGHTVARGLCGDVLALDIGLVASNEGIELADAAWVRETIPAIGAESHKGTRKKLVVQGGGPGMAGAVILGLRAALASGIGMVKARVSPETVDAIHEAVAAALVDPAVAKRPAEDDAPDTWADALVIGPGLGLGPETKAVVERAIRRHRGPILLDADALNAFAGDASALHPLLGGRPALLTPHPVECARLLGIKPQAVLDRRFDIGLELAKQTGATVLLKGVPTVIASPDGRRMVVAEGTPSLATGGSGDLLSGIAGTLLAQIEDPLRAAACAAWIHGRAAWLAGAFVRGTTLDDVLEMLPNAWRIGTEPARYPVIAELRAIPDR